MTSMLCRMSTIKAWFWRGGVCNALIFHKSDLPTDRSRWQQLFASAMGSPDPYGRQLNGMGGGVSSLSKICVVSPSERKDADVDFEFVQVVIENGSLDLASNCGNMTAAIGPFALDQDLFRPPISQLSDSSNLVTVRIFNTNTNKVIASTFPTVGRPPRYDAHGSYKMDGVPGTASKIALSFTSPGGTQTSGVFPTGDRVTLMSILGPSGEAIKASLLDVANPAVYVDGISLGIDPDVLPSELEQQASTMELLERIRRDAAAKMGLDPNIASVPKIVALFSPEPEAVKAGQNIKSRCLSMGQAHKAIPLTIALNLAVACRMQGTIAFELAKNMKSEGAVGIQHPSGTIEVGTHIEGEKVEAATIYGTARLLMRGEVNVS